MRSLTICLAAVGLAAGLGITPVAAEQGGKPFSVPMTGAAEAPGPGDPDGSGTATLRLNPGQTQVCYELKVSSVTLPASAAHIHKAPAGQAGGPVVALTAPAADGTSKGCADIAKDVAQELLKNPDQFYVNVHTSDFPAGAVRGQLSRAGAAASK